MSPMQSDLKHIRFDSTLYTVNFFLSNELSYHRTVEESSFSLSFSHYSSKKGQKWLLTPVNLNLMARAVAAHTSSLKV